MKQLSSGDTVRLISGQTATVKKLLGEGGQGYVYLVSVGGKDMALKWYKDGVIHNIPKFYENLKTNVRNGAPTAQFIWPKYVTEIQDGHFGYVMDLRPSGYFEFTKFLLVKAKFSNFLAVINAAMEICEGFKALHAIGYSYQDMNDGNFFINPQTGHVLICDNDNAFPNGEESGILGKARYMAPEIVLGKNRPNTYSDRFSLSTILFMLFYMNHPFEGAKVISYPCLTDAIEKKCYGSEILFICDAQDKSNQPVMGEHKNVIARWPLLPASLRRTFVNEFSQEKLHNPQKRSTEQQWLDVITKVRDCMVICPHCKKETFVNIETSNSCLRCGKKIEITNTLCFDGRVIPLTNRNNIYLDRDNIPDLCVAPYPNDPSILVMYNKTPDVITVDTPSGKVNKVEPNGMIPVKPGLHLMMKAQNREFEAIIK